MVRPTVRAFGELLRQYREAAGMSQAKLAEKAMLSLRGINDLERGERKAPRWSTVAHLVEALALNAEQRQTLLDAARAARAVDSLPMSDTPALAPEAAHTDRFPTPLAPVSMTPAQRLPIGGYLGSLPDVPLVGRETQRAKLVADLEAIGAGGGGGLVLLAGEPGIGKTRLAQEMMQAALNRGFLVASGRCYEPQSAIAYFPFLEALSMAYGAAPTSLRAALPHRWPDVARLLSDQEIGASPAPPAHATAGANDQQRLFLQVSGFLHALAGERPVALLLDDLHWADGASLDLTQHLARRTHGSRILLLGTYRDSGVSPARPLEPLLRDLWREHLVTRVPVERLSLDGTTALLAAIFGRGTFSDEFAKMLHGQTEGNPFYTTELVRELVERGDVYQENGRWQKRQRVDFVLPESVRSVIGLRLARLSSATQTALQEASVLGPAFRFMDLQAMSALSEAQVETALDEAEEAVLVREVGQDGYVFHHVLIQQTLYAQLSARHKRRLHRAAGEALERQGDREREWRVAKLAYHFAHTDQYERALQYATRAAERMREAAARREEAEFLGQAIEAAMRMDDLHLVTELRVKRGEAFNAAAMWIDGARELEAAITHLPSDQAERRIGILIELSTASYFSSGFDSQAIHRARDYATRALALAESIGRDDLAAHATSQLAMCDTNAGLVRESQLLFERAFARAGAGHVASLLHGLDQYGLNWYYLGDFEAADTHTRLALEVARSAHDAAIITRTLGNLGMALTGSGRYGEALETFAEARRSGFEYGAWAWLARSISMCAGLHLALGDLARAETLTEEAREVNRAIQFPNVSASTGIDLLFIFARRHEVGRAQGLLPRVREDVSKAVGAHGWLTALRLAQAQAEVAFAQGALDEAVRFAEDSIAQARQRGRLKYEVLAMQARAQARAGQGHVNEAIVGLRAALALARDTGDPALFLRTAASLLPIAGDDALLAEARASVKRISTALPDDLRRVFLDTDPVWLVSRLSHYSL